MERLMRFGLLVVACSIFCQVGYAAESPVGAVNHLYHDFAWEAVGAPSSKHGLAQQPKAILLRYFTPQLSAALAADAECAARTQEICALDFLPLWASQDPAATNLQVTPGAQSGQVKVRYIYPPTGAVVVLRYRLLQTKAGWRVSDIVYPSGESLASLLAGTSR